MPGSPVCLPVITGPTHFALIPAASMPSCFSFAPTFVALALSTHAELLAASACCAGLAPQDLRALLSIWYFKHAGCLFSAAVTVTFSELQHPTLSFGAGP